MERRTVVSSAGLRRVLGDSQALPALLQRLHPKVVGRLIDDVGLHDAGELMALTPRKKLLAVFDESIWKSPAAGVDDVLDVGELVEWLTVWIDVGEAFVVECFAAMSDEYFTLCMAHLIRVDDEDAVAYSRYDNDSDADENGDASDAEEAVEDGQCDRFGPYLVHSAVADQSDIVRVVLNALWTDAPDRLLRILAMLTDRESMLTQRGPHGSFDHDMAFERQRHREHQGYVTAFGARAFLAFGTTASLNELLTLAEYDNESRRHLSGSGGTAGQHNPVAVGAADEIDAEDATDPNPTVVGVTKSGPPGHELDERIAEELQSLLQYFQPLSSSPAFLLEHRDNQRRLPLLTLLDELSMENYGAFEQCERELAYLANVAISALRSNSAALDAAGARSMALATCNLGLELLRAKQLPIDLAREPGLLRLFLVGWHSLNELPARIRQAFERVAAMSNPDVLRQRRRWLIEQVRVGLNDLACSLAQRNFAAAREAATLLSIAFDRSSCRAVALLLDEIPRFPTSLEGAALPRGARWLESIEDLNRVAALLSNLTFRS